jgi:DNA-binding MarR family transcriptional regulator
MRLTLIPALHRATHQIGLYLERTPGLEVTQAEAHILAHLAEHGESSIGELHRSLAHRRSTLTSILDRLVARGLVTREVSASDRRSFMIALSTEGGEVAQRAHERLLALERRAIEEAGRAAELGALLGALERAAGSS